MALVQGMALTNFWPLTSLALTLGLWLQTVQLHKAEDHAATLQHQQELDWVQTKNIETRMRNDAAQKDKETQSAITVAHADADRARAAAVGLRRDMASFIEARRRRAQAAAAAGQCAPDESAAVVLADLFSRADARAGELAAALDESRARGSGCAAIYDAIAAPAQE